MLATFYSYFYTVFEKDIKESPFRNELLSKIVT